MRHLIVGVGSPFGDDAAGLEAARRLAESPPAGTVVLAADRPGAGLIELLDGAETVILIDAVRSGAPPGTLHDLSLAELTATGRALASSHALGVAEALALARALGRAPRRGRVLGIEARPGRARRMRLGPAVRLGIERAVERARQWANRLQPAAGRARRARAAGRRESSRRAAREAPHRS